MPRSRRIGVISQGLRCRQRSRSAGTHSRSIFGCDSPEPHTGNGFAPPVLDSGSGGRLTTPSRWSVGRNIAPLIRLFRSAIRDASLHVSPMCPRGVTLRTPNAATRVAKRAASTPEKLRLIRFFFAETEGFEPSEPLRVLHLSRVVHSTGLCDVSRYCLAHHSRMPGPVESNQACAAQPLNGCEHV